MSGCFAGCFAASTLHL